jgi:calmodulin
VRISFFRTSFDNVLFACLVSFFTQVMFLQLDKNRDGEVDILELASGLKTLHVTLTQEQLLAFRDDMDVGKNGAVSLDEFLMAVKVRMKLQATIDASDPNVAKTDAAWTAVLKGAEKNPGAWAERVGNMFSKFDADGSGTIDIKELGSGLASLGVVLDSSQLRAFREDIDFDGDGEISLPEFLMAVRQHERLKEQAKSSGKNAPGSGIAMIDTFDDLELDAFNRASNEAFAKIIAIASSDPKGWKKSVAKVFATFDRDGSRQVSFFVSLKNLLSLV